MVTRLTKKKDAIAQIPSNETTNTWLENDDATDLAGNNTLSSNEQNNVLEDNAGRNKLLKNIANPQASKKPRLEARWVSENGKLICKWLCYENEEGS
jgi:hypothetical protein